MANLIVGKNDLATKFPKLALEWICSEHNLTPSLVTYGSQEKVLWKCAICGSEWHNVVSERTRHPGCPFCNGRRVRVGYNDFYTWCIETNNKLYLKEWMYDLNNQIYSSKGNPKHFYKKSHKKVWWKCSICGHEYQRSILDKYNGCRCPVCSSKELINGINDLQTWAKKNKPLILKEWDYSQNGNPENYINVSNKKVDWICSTCGYKWSTAIRNRTKMNSGCPSCAGVILVKGINDLETWCKNNNKEFLLEEWDYQKNLKKPSEITKANREKAWWKCPTCGNNWETNVVTRTMRNSKCPNCLNKGTSFPEQVIMYYLKIHYPDSINRYKIDGIEFDVFIPSKNTAIEYDGLYWHDNPQSYIRDNKKDEYCNIHNIKLIRIREYGLDKTLSAINLFCKSKDNNDIEKVTEDILKILNVKSIININKDYENIVLSLRKELKENCLLIKFPQIASEWDYEKNSLTPEQVSWGSSLKAWWKCPQGHSWQTTVNARTNTNRGCPYCNRKKVLFGYNDLETHFPEIAKEWNYIKNSTIDNLPNSPREITSKSNKKVWWRCSKCGYEWVMPVNKRTINGRGCPQCRNSHQDKN